MFIGWIEADLQIPLAHSLKDKRAVIRPLIARLRQHHVSVAEVGNADLHQRAHIGIAVTSSSFETIEGLLNTCENIFVNSPEVTLLSVRRHTVAAHDFDEI